MEKFKRKLITALSTALKPVRWMVRKGFPAYLALGVMSAIGFESSNIALVFVGKAVFWLAISDYIATYNKLMDAKIPKGERETIYVLRDIRDNDKKLAKFESFDKANLARTEPQYQDIIKFDHFTEVVKRHN